MRTRHRTYSTHFDQPESNGRRLRLAINLTLLGGVLGSAQFIINLLAQTEFPKEPLHLSLDSSLIVSSRAWVAGTVLAATISGIATSDWAGQRADTARTLFVWIALGIGYGILLPALTGMLIPISGVFLALGSGFIGPDEALPATFDSIVRAPYAGLVQAGVGMITGLLAGVVFALGAWMIDAANSSASIRVSRYGTYAITVVMSALIAAGTALVPPAMLAKLG
jgi:hypothetical protein